VINISFYTLLLFLSVLPTVCYF